MRLWTELISAYLETELHDDPIENFFGANVFTENNFFSCVLTLIIIVYYILMNTNYTYKFRVGLIVISFHTYKRFQNRIVNTSINER